MTDLTTPGSAPDYRIITQDKNASVTIHCYQRMSCFLLSLPIHLDIIIDPGDFQFVTFG